jgi:probable phosphoglycerate mutase
VIASPRRRALDTAREVVAHVHGVVAVDERLAEVDFGSAEGLSFESVRRRWPTIAERLLAAELDIDWPGGESAIAFRTRMREVALALASPPGDLVVVSHAGPIRVLAELFGADAAPNVVDVAPGGIVVLRNLPQDPP